MSPARRDRKSIVPLPDRSLTVAAQREAAHRAATVRERGDHLLITNGFDGIQFGRLYCRINPEEQSNKDRHAESYNDRRGSYHRRPAGDRGDNARKRETESDSNEPA